MAQCKWDMIFTKFEESCCLPLLTTLSSNKVVAETNHNTSASGAMETARADVTAQPCTEHDPVNTQIVDDTWKILSFDRDEDNSYSSH